MKEKITVLLHADDAQIVEQLNELQSEEISTNQVALVLLWQIHKDEAIKEQANALLESVLSPDERSTITEIFSIFTSVLEFLPWMGDYQDLQKKNFDLFVAGKAPYESYIINSKFVEDYLNLGRQLYMMFELVDEAESCFEAIINQKPDYAEALYALGRVAESRYEIEKALDLYERCVAADEQHIYGLLQLGMLKADIGDYKNAITYYDRAVELEPFMVEIHVRLAEAHFALGDVKRAYQFLEAALGINEYYDEALNLLGIVQWKHEKDIEAAVETFNKGVDHKIHGDSGLLLASLGDVYANHFNDHDRARVYYEKSLKAKPKQAKTVRQLLVLLENVFQDYGAMAACYEQYLSLVKHDLDFYVDYADFLIKYMHDYVFAKVQLDEVLSMDGSHERALKLVDQISEYLEEEEEDDDWDDDDDDFVGGGAAGDS